MIKKAILYFGTVTLLLFALRSLHYKGLLKQPVGYYAKLNTAFFKANHYNVVFLGSSRVEMHYDPFLFDRFTGYNSFNLGLAGATPQLAYAALSTYLERSQAPAYLFYEVDYHSLSKESNEIKDFNNYFPFLSHGTLRKHFQRMDHRMEHFYYNPYFSWPYTGLKNISTGIHNWLGIPNRTDTLYYKGFVKEVLRPSLNYIKSPAYYSFFHPTNRNYLDSIILLCKQKNIQLSLITSPMFAGGKTGLMNKNQVTQQVHAIASRNGIQYYDLSLLPFCNERSLFVDHYHLNYQGAKKFSRYLADLFNNKTTNYSLNCY